MVIFLFGADTFRSKEKLEAIKEKYRREIDHTGLNCTVLTGQTLSAASLQAAVFTPPFLATKRLVIVTNLIVSKPDEPLEQAVLKIIQSDSNEQTILVFWEGDVSNISGKQKLSPLFTALKKVKFAQEFQPLRAAELKPFITKLVSQAGTTIQPAALDALVDLVGPDSWRLSTEVKKLAAHANGGPITAADVNTLIASKLDDDIFKLTDALGRRDKKTALHLINDQLRGGMSPTELLSRISWQYRNLLLVKTFMDQNGTGYSAERLSFPLNLHPFVIKKTAGQANHYTIDSLKRLYQQIEVLEYKIKTSQSDPQTLFDLLVLSA